LWLGWAAMNLPSSRPRSENAGDCHGLGAAHVCGDPARRMIVSVTRSPPTPVSVSRWPAGRTDLDQPAQNADLAMYDAKADGAGPSFLRARHGCAGQARHQFELDLRHAITAGESKFTTQPIVDLKTTPWPVARRCCAGASDRGLIAPAEFIPIARTPD